MSAPAEGGADDAQAVPDLADEVRGRHPHVDEREAGEQVRAVAERVDELGRPQPSMGPGTSSSASDFRGSGSSLARHTTDIRSGPVPSQPVACETHCFAPVHDPAVALPARGGPQADLRAVAGIDLVEVGGAAGLAQRQRGERRAGRREEGRQEPRPLRGLPARSSGASPRPVENRLSATLGIARDELLGQRRGRRRPGSVAAQCLRDEPCGGTRPRPSAVERPGRAVPLGRRGQRVGHLAGAGEHVARELAAVRAGPSARRGRCRSDMPLSAPRSGRRRRAGSRPSRTPRSRGRARRARSPRSRPCGPSGAARRRRRAPRRGASGS